MHLCRNLFLKEFDIRLCIHSRHMKYVEEYIVSDFLSIRLFVRSLVCLYKSFVLLLFFFSKPHLKLLVHLS